MPISAGVGLLIGGGLSAAGSIAGASINSSAASNATSQQVAEQQQGLAIQQQEFNQNQANQQPFVSAGQGSIQQILTSLQNGTFGPGSIPPFTLPTLQQAEQTPGYQFNLEQGNKGILQGAAASGGAFSGGTLKALAGYDQGLASTTYQQQVGNALTQYQALLTGQQQGYNQIANVASLGENAAANAGNAGVASTAQIGNTLSNIGATQAAGTVAGANAISGGINGVANAGSLLGLYNAFQQGQQPQLQPGMTLPNNSSIPAAAGGAANLIPPVVYSGPGGG